MLTDEQLNAIKARRKAITPYDWTWSRDYQSIVAWVGIDKGLGVLRVDENGRLEIRHEDAVFIEYAPADISMLIAALEDARATIARYHERIARFDEKVQQADAEGNVPMRYSMMHNLVNDILNMPVGTSTEDTHAQT